MTAGNIAANVFGMPDANRPPRRMNRKVIAGVVLIVVAGTGFAAGIATDRMMVGRQFSAGMVDAPDARAQHGIGDRLARELGLTSTQRAQVDAIIGRQTITAEALRREYQPRVRAIMIATRAAIDSVLTPAQQERLRTLTSKQPTGYR